jgi:hypothetical protein
MHYYKYFFRFTAKHSRSFSDIVGDITAFHSQEYSRYQLSLEPLSEVSMNKPLDTADIMNRAAKMAQRPTQVNPYSIPNVYDETPDTDASRTRAAPIGITETADALQHWNDKNRFTDRQDVDGYYVIREGASLTATGLTLIGTLLKGEDDQTRANRLADRLEALDTRLLGVQTGLDAERDRVNQATTRLEQLGDRTEQVKAIVEPENFADEPDQPAESTISVGGDPVLEEELGATQNFAPANSQASQIPQASAEPKLDATDRFADHANKFNQEIHRLGKQVGIDDPYQPIVFNRSGSIHEQLNQIEKIIDQLERKVERLEIAVFGQTQVESIDASQSNQSISASPTHQAHPQGDHSSQTVEGRIIAEHLSNFIQSRANVQQTSPTEEVSTTIGVMRMTTDQGKQSVILSDRNLGEVFRAHQTGQEEWHIETHDLQDATQLEKILNLPQTPEHYEGWQTAKAWGRQVQQEHPELFSEATDPHAVEHTIGSRNVTLTVPDSRTNSLTLEVHTADHQRHVLSLKFNEDKTIEVLTNHIPTKALANDLARMQSDRQTQRHPPQQELPSRGLEP